MDDDDDDGVRMTTASTVRCDDGGGRCMVTVTMGMLVVRCRYGRCRCRCRHDDDDVAGAMVLYVVHDGAQSQCRCALPRLTVVRCMMVSGSVGAVARRQRSTMTAQACAVVCDDATDKTVRRYDDDVRRNDVRR